MTDKKIFGGKPYQIWSGMKRRCCNSSHKDFARYGGRGITVCEEWKTFFGFWNDMQDGYKKDLTIDRVDNNKDYCKENCRWATRKEQANNRSSNHRITIDNVTKTLSQWTDESGLKPSTVRQRFTTYGWDIKRALGIND